jgi:uncharacterized OB-fold protein
MNRPLPEPDDQSAPFWDAAARRELVIQTCASCGVMRHPPQPMCPRCNETDHTWSAASGRATVWSWIVCRPPVLPAFDDKVPYNVVVVELEEGVRMIGNLLDVPNDEIAIGLPVTVDFEDAGEGVVLPQWKRA